MRTFKKGTWRNRLSFCSMYVCSTLAIWFYRQLASGNLIFRFRSASADPFLIYKL